MPLDVRMLIEDEDGSGRTLPLTPRHFLPLDTEGFDDETLTVSTLIVMPTSSVYEPESGDPATLANGSVEDAAIRILTTGNAPTATDFVLRFYHV